MLKSVLGYNNIINSFISKIIYNFELILLLCNSKTSLGTIPIDIKKTILEIYIDTQQIIKLFVIDTNLIRLSPNNLLSFYYPVYNNYNNCEYLLIGLPINLNLFMKINETHTDEQLFECANDLIMLLKNYTY